MPCGADTTANTLLTSLLAGKSFDLPDVDLSDDMFQIPVDDGSIPDNVDKLTNEDLTTRVVDGSGVFDALMSSLSAHLKKEYEQNRITGEQYTKAYTASLGGALQTATSFLLGRDQAYWQAVLAQMQARTNEIQVVTARVQLEVAKAQLATARIQAMNAEAEFGLTKMKIATEDQQYCLLKTQTEQGEYTLNEIMPLQSAQLTLQNSGLDLDNDTKSFTLMQILPTQKTLLEEQVEVQRAQTMDTRTNGVVIRGSVGKQKDLYTQQITSYQRDAEVKAAKLFTDAWITQKTIDEGLLAPGAFRNESVNVILRNIKANNNIENDPGAQDGDL